MMQRHDPLLQLPLGLLGRDQQPLEAGQGEVGGQLAREYRFTPAGRADHQGRVPPEEAVA